MRQTTTRIQLFLDTREWNWEIAGNLTPGAIQDIVRPVIEAHPHTNRLLAVSRTPKWIDVATRVADWWLARPGWLRFAAYAIAGVILGFMLRVL